jgi:exonuclease VII large subunit
MVWRIREILHKADRRIRLIILTLCTIQVTVQGNRNKEPISSAMERPGWEVREAEQYKGNERG